MHSPIPHKIPYRADIDGLRAFAVLAVIIYHASPGHLPGGFIGVDVFFVISGFLITSLILESCHSGTFSYWNFYARRIRRILPALLIVLGASLLAGAILLLPHPFQDLARIVASAVIFVPNFALWLEEGYFGPNALHRPLLHLWSLGVEEQFYFFWPLLVALLWRRTLPWAITGLAAISFLVCVLLVGNHPSEAFYFPLTRLWELLAGAFLAWRERSHIEGALGVAQLSKPLRELIAAAALVSLFWAVRRLNPTLPFPGWWTLVPVIATMFAIGAGPDVFINRKLLANPVAVWAGLISYPLYLWHWPILVFAGLAKGDSLSQRESLGCLTAATILAALTFWLVERPIRSARLPGRRKVIVAALLAISLLIGLISLTIIVGDGWLFRFPPQFRAFLTFRYDDPTNTNWKPACFLQADQLPEAWTERNCLETGNKPLVILWGDSHAAQLRPGLDALPDRTRFRLGEMTGAGCGPYINWAAPNRPHCHDENALYLREIQKLKPDTVIVATWWFQNGIGPIRQSIEALKAFHVHHIAIVGPVPQWPTPLPEVLARAAMKNKLVPPTTLPFDMEHVPRSLDRELRAIALSEGVTYASPLSVFCPRDSCTVMVGHRPLDVTTFDYAHFTDAGSRFLVKAIRKSLLPDLAKGPSAP